MAYNLKINGKSQTVDVPAEMPMLWVLRDSLNMKGTKFGCGVGACGACTIHVDGVAVRGCQTRVDAVGTKAVTTIEGLSTCHNADTVRRDRSCPLLPSLPRHPNPLMRRSTRP
jgi:aerobic-type carbon monoxide dehydrogenase small subunit (CoxS/CutS family)